MYLQSVITHRLRGTAKLEELPPDRSRANHPKAVREYREQERRDALRYRALKFLEPGHQNLQFLFCFPVLLVIFDHSFTFNTPLGSIRAYRTERAWHRFGPIGAVSRFQVALNKPILNRESRNSFKVNRVWSPWYFSRWVQSLSYGAPSPRCHTLMWFVSKRNNTISLLLIPCLEVPYLVERSPRNRNPP